jgi:hypothetical protein
MKASLVRSRIGYHHRVTFRALPTLPTFVPVGVSAGRLETGETGGCTPPPPAVVIA